MTSTSIKPADDFIIEKADLEIIKDNRPAPLGDYLWTVQKSFTRGVDKEQYKTRKTRFGAGFYVQKSN